MTLFAEYAPRSPAGEDGPSGLPPETRVRPAREADVEAIAGLRAAREGGTLEEHVARARDALARASAPGAEEVVLVAEVPPEVAGEVVAYARAGRFTPAASAPANTAPAGYYLGGVIVAEPFRRRGIGAELTRARLAWIAGRAREAYYFVNARNRASIDLHAPFGFVELTRDFHHPAATFTGGIGILFRASL